VSELTAWSTWNSVLILRSILGRILPGIVADKIGRYNTIIVITLVSAVFSLALWIPSKSNAAIIVFLIIFGFSSGGFISLGPACIAQICDIRQIGTRTGAAYAVMAFGALTGSPIGGAIVSAQHGDFLGLQLFCGFSMLLSVFFFVAARYAQVGLKVSAIV
jgi:MFS family permease